MLEHDMALLVDWYKANQLSLNVDKTVLIKFWSENNPFNILIEGNTINKSKGTRFLGITIEENLTWNEYVQNIISKLLTNKRLLANAHNILTSFAMKNIYYAHIYSHLTYGLVVWGSMMKKSSQNDIYKIQKDCIKILSKKKNDHTIGELFKQNCILTYPSLIQQELLKLGYKIDHRILPKPLLDMFNMNEGKKLHRYPIRRRRLPNIQVHTN